MAPEDAELKKVGVIYGDVGTTEFRFTVSGYVEQGDYVQVLHPREGWVLGRVDAMERKTDLSLEKAHVMARGGKVDISEMISATVSVIGYRDEHGILQHPRTPFPAGAYVYLARDELIREVLGIDEHREKGAYIGKLYGHDIPIYLDINRLIQKHMAVLAKTGSGKSYFTGVILEELLKHSVTAVVIDPHGEYGSLRKPARRTPAHDEFGVSPRGYGDRILMFSPDPELNRGCRPLNFTLSHMSPRDLLNLMNLGNTRSYLVPLRKAMDLLKTSKGDFTLRELMRVIEAEEEDSLGPLLGGLEYLDEVGIFARRGTRITDLVQKGKLAIVNLRGVPPDIQQLVVQRLATALFELRKRNRIPPLFLVVEEAHNFVPQQGKADSSAILRTIASEGRKFGLGLAIISQRPAKIDKNVLSQCNTQIILRVTNPNDLNAIGKSVEGLTKGSLEEIQRLPIGVALVVGANIPMPIFVKVRPRETMHGGQSVEVL